MSVSLLRSYISFLDRVASEHGGILTGLFNSGLQYYGFKFDPDSPLLENLRFVKRYQNDEGNIYVFINLHDHRFYVTASPRTLVREDREKEL